MARPDQVRNPMISASTSTSNTSDAETIIRPQPVRPVMVSNRPWSTPGESLRTLHGVQATIDRTVDLIAGSFLRHWLGIGSQQLIDDELLCRCASTPVDSQPVPLDAEAASLLFGDGEIDRWLGAVRQRNEAAVAEGPAAYADAVMRDIFPGTGDMAAARPALVDRICSELDAMVLVAALDCELDLPTLERLCSVAGFRFLCNVVLLPRLRIDPTAFPSPSPSVKAIDKSLMLAFDRHSCPQRAVWMRTNRAALSPRRKSQLQALYREGNLQKWIETHRTQVDKIGRLEPEFMAVARTCLQTRFRHWSFGLMCLLRIYQSYPLSLELAVERRSQLARLRGADNDERQQLADRRTELTIQKERWSDDLQFIRRMLPAIDSLSEHGRSYLMQKLIQLAQAAYRPRIGALELREVLEHAVRQRDVLVEQDEPDQ